MSVEKLWRELNDLLEKGQKIDEKAVERFREAAEGWFGVPEDEWVFLHNTVLREHGDCFASEAARRELERFLVQVKFTPTLKEWLLQHLRVVTLFIESFWGQFRQFFKDGTAHPDVIRRVREKASQENFRGTVSLAKVPIKAKVDEIREALKKTIAAIHGFDFLDRGKTADEHTILIKVGVNWGYFGYPTATSWESVYAVTAMCFDEAAKRGAKLKKVIVGDESGMENVLWNHTTTRNLAHSKILHGAVLAGLERAAAQEHQDPGGEFKGAGELFAKIKKPYWVPPDDFLEDPLSDPTSREMIQMAQKAGVEVVAFDEGEFREKKWLPIPDIPDGKDKRFPEGILVPRKVAEEVTDIINLPKPPGRHLIMGNTGLTGALKNHVGLMAGSERATDPYMKGTKGLHGMCDRYPKFKRGTPESYLDNLEARHQALEGKRSRKAARRLAWDVLSTNRSAPDLIFHEKIVEIYLAFAAKERFSATDMRRTISSLGPDWGDTMNIEAVIAARDPLTLDVFAGALLKRRYEQGEKNERGKKLGFLWGLLHALKPGGDTFLEYLIGKTWLRAGTTPFDLMSHIAANSYRVGPVDLDHIDLKGFENSGYSCEEMLDIIRYVTPAQPSRP